MKAINIWMLGTVLFSGLMSCEMKEEIFGKEIPSETGYLTLDVNVGSSASVETKGATDNKEEFPLVINSVDFDFTKSYASFAKFKEENEDGVIELPIGNYEIEAHSPGEFAEKMKDPYFGGVEKIEITSGVEKPTTVKCKIQNVKIAMNFTSEFINHYSEWSITVDDKCGHSDIYTQENPNPAPIYWKMAAETDKIYVSGTATVKETSEKVTINQTLMKKGSADFVEGDDSYFVGGDGLVISLAPGKDVELNKTGISITVNGFNQEINENIDIEVEGDNGEGKPEPPTSGPTITIPQALYTLPADEEKEANVIISTPAGLKNITVAIKGGNEFFASIVKDLFGEEFELIGNETLGETLESMGVTLPVGGEKNYEFPVHAFFSLLLDPSTGGGVTTDPEGHVFNITVEDNDGKIVKDKLSVKVTE
ncbi:DUF4493 domain-containing protein [uncultured Parabacteroides sp.]|uniref:DUF4493 domain-containing protein n=1 Tax=uncultured Parabacteroides sp. TaxID=512312 RepID=UPI0026148DF9|nr:DUF4493 domain-containing protein [uncultured Parabacteroides sp.]